MKPNSNSNTKKKNLSSQKKERKSRRKPTQPLPQPLRSVTKDYLVVIASYRRAETLEKKTLALLRRHRIPKEKIYIFVADQSEYDIYQQTLTPYYQEMIIGKPGMCAIRNVVAKHFPNGQKLFSMDDDLSDLIELTKQKQGAGKELVKPEYRSLPNGKLDNLIRQGFQECLQHQLQLFGIYPANNPFFMQKRITYDLRYIIGSCWGCINDQEIVPTLDDKEDVERTIKSYRKYGGVVRLNHITAQSGYYTEKGGMQETRTRTRVRTSADALVKEYPHLTKLKLTKKSGYAEVVLRDREHKYSRQLEPKQL